MSDTDNNDVKRDGEKGEPITIRVRDQVRLLSGEARCRSFFLFAEDDWRVALWFKRQ